MVTSRNWNDHDEDVLLTILEEMVVDGVRCETDSFKAGTFVMVAMKIREMILGINIEPKHIQNKLKRLKEKYSFAYDMMNTSGFGWDDEKKCVVVDSDDVLQLWVKCLGETKPRVVRLNQHHMQSKIWDWKIRMAMRHSRCLRLHLPHLLLLVHQVHLNLLGKGRGIRMMLMQIL